MAVSAAEMARAQAGTDAARATFIFRFRCHDGSGVRAELSLDIAPPETY